MEELTDEQESVLVDMEQNLWQYTADFLDSEDFKILEAVGKFKDPVQREKSELHMRMAKAAMEEYKRTVKQ